MTELIASNVELTKQVYDTFAKGDVESLVQRFWDPQIEWIEPASLPIGGRFLGPQEVLENVFSKIEETWGTEFHATPQVIHDAGDVITVQGTYAGVLKGISYEVPFCHVLKVRDGKFHYFQAYVDTAGRPA